MTHPFQLVCACKAEGFGEGLLLAACGPSIVSVKLEDGSVVSQWPSDVETGTQKPQDEEHEQGGPPGKKRKLEQEPKVSPNVIKLALSPDQRYAVAVTGDDKCVRVFEIESSGKLTALSQRCMPKRPCAILVTPDNQTIICGDKFGDVYSLPLLVAADTETTSTTQLEAEAAVKAFTPTATNLTVHTARNRRALEAQMKQKDLQAKPRGNLKFQHQLLLGHVSMLTDVHFTAGDVDGKSRNFIITSDRDEHIRVSRAPPHAYVIERYCLGHKEFISKLCVLPDSNALVSGGGDDWLGFWDWQDGVLKQSFNLKTALQGPLDQAKIRESSGEEPHVAVSGLWAVPSSDRPGFVQQDTLLVASERCPALLALAVDKSGSRVPSATVVELPGNPLDVAIIGQRIIVSIDTAESNSRLLAYNVQTDDGSVALVSDDKFGSRLQAVNEMVVSAQRSDDVLYGIENLRKRTMEEDHEAE